MGEKDKGRKINPVDSELEEDGRQPSGKAVNRSEKN